MKINSVPVQKYSVTENIFNELFVDLTNKCNLQCQMCYSATGTSTNHKSNDDKVIKLSYYEDICQALPRPTIIALLGGEPTLRKDFLEFIKVTHKYGHTAFISSNGIRFAKDKTFMSDFSKVAKSGNTRLHIDFSGGYSKSLHTKIYGTDLVKTKLEALNRLKEYNIGKVLVACVLVRGFNEDVISDIFDIGEKYKRIVRILKFRAQGHNGRWISETSPYSSVEILKLLEEHLRSDEIYDNIYLSGHLKSKNYQPHKKCKGKSCCVHFKRNRSQEINILECFTHQGTCWRKGRLNLDFTIEPVFEGYTNLLKS